MKYYHVDRANKLKIGEIQLINPNPINKINQMFFPDGISKSGEIYLADEFINSNNTPINSRELNFEFVRRLYYPHMPSRYQSFFCVETLEEAYKWIGYFESGQSTNSPQILEIVSEREGFRFDSSWRDGIFRVEGKVVFSAWEEINMAHKYWSGEMYYDPRIELVVPLINNHVYVNRVIG